MLEWRPTEAVFSVVVTTVAAVRKGEDGRICAEAMRSA